MSLKLAIKWPAKRYDYKRFVKIHCYLPRNSVYSTNNDVYIRVFQCAQNGLATLDSLADLLKRKEKNVSISCEVTSFIISRSISTETLFSILRDLRYCCVLALSSSRWILGSRLRSISCRRFISSSFSFVRRLCCSHSWQKKAKSPD